ncbi:hypothetical protein FANTH_3629 [Fusarium anthophilum]|uniref:Uncharacterized protein n=1 Tax=Fusarium anthophilum TaxID=48485 RepID=A0A8H5E8N6_9HYPO|nr:hypothetical protein FANTH_3629 [Fusarium anthophilum]
MSSMTSSSRMLGVSERGAGNASGSKPVILETERLFEGVDDAEGEGEASREFGSCLYKYIATGILGASTDMEADAGTIKAQQQEQTTTQRDSLPWHLEEGDLKGHDETYMI